MLLKNINKQKKYLLAVSGGVDSMVLCDLFLKNNFSFAVAHCNFQLRDTEANDDENFVMQYCQLHKISFFIKKFGTKKFADENKLSIQEAARKLRYEYFYDFLEKEKIHHIVTAHHQDDNIETVLFHFFRGTGIKGLVGIPFENNKIIRPLLSYSKQEIINYATQHNIQYREDSSNAKSDYTRNKLRNEIIPALEKDFPALKQNITNNITRIHEAHLLYEQQISIYKKKVA